MDPNCLSQQAKDPNETWTSEKGRSWWRKRGHKPRSTSQQPEPIFLQVLAVTSWEPVRRTYHQPLKTTLMCTFSVEIVSNGHLMSHNQLASTCWFYFNCRFSGGPNCNQLHTLAMRSRPCPGWLLSSHLADFARTGVGNTDVFLRLSKSSTRNASGGVRTWTCLGRDTKFGRLWMWLW